MYCKKEHPFDYSMCPETDKHLTPVHKLANTLIEEKYKVKNLIGEGGMGVIYESEHVGIGKKYAIKFLNPQVCQSRNAYERFKRKARATAIIAHKNIVDVIDIGTTAEGVPYIVIEYLSGEDLGARICSLGSIQVREAAAILAQVLEALDAVHSHGIVHRDLKPENVFLAGQSGGSEIVKVLDFGISKLIESDEISVNISSSGIIFGTPYYASPEQAEGERRPDHRADLYAAGVIFYEMITGRLPFTATAYGKLLLEIIMKPVPDPEQYLPGLPPDIKSFVLKSLLKKPHERFQSAGEMLAALQNLDVDEFDQAAAPVAVARVRLETKSDPVGKKRPSPVEEITDLKHQKPPEATKPAPDRKQAKPRKHVSIFGKPKPSVGTYSMVSPRKDNCAEKKEESETNGDHNEGPQSNP